MNHSPQNWNEGRRLQAWQLKQRGWSQRQIAAALGVSEGAVSQGMTRAREGGPALPGGCPANNGLACLTCCTAAPKPMASGARCGHAAGWPP
jgi:Homeodomain-like domain